MLVADRKRELVDRENNLVRDFIYVENCEECLGARFLYLLGHALEAGLLVEIAERIGRRAYPIAIGEKSGWLLLPDSRDQKVPKTQGLEEPRSTTRIPESTQS